MCDCNYEKESSPNDKELVIEKIMSTSHCTVQLEEGEIAQGKRTDICNGNLPPSKKEREDEVGQKDKNLNRFKRNYNYVLVQSVSQPIFIK